MTERAPNKEAAPLPPIEQQEWKGEFWRAVSAQAANEKHPDENQDVIRVDPEIGLFVLCDGMGGHEGGRTAALLVAGAINDYFRTLDWDLDDHEVLDVLPKSMIAAVRHAQTRLMNERGETDMDTTATALLVRKLASGTIVAVVGHVGNCRAYAVEKNGHVVQLTEDHDLMRTELGAKLVLGELPAAELDRRRREVRRELDESESRDTMSDEARMLLKYRNRTLSVGDDTMTVDVEVSRFSEGGRIALLSDGAHENLGYRRTGGLLSVSTTQDIREVSRTMVAEAQINGHRRPKSKPLAHPDDISMLIIEPA